MRRALPRRFWFEALLAGVSAFLFLLTLIWRDWLERAFGFDPDNHNGSLEWLIVAALLVAAVSLGVFARSEWRRALPAN